MHLLVFDKLQGAEACIYQESLVYLVPVDAGWSSLVARRAHNPKVVGSNPAPATNSMAARCSVVIASEAPFGAFLWVIEKWAGGRKHVGQGSAIDAAFAADS